MACFICPVCPTERTLSLNLNLSEFLKHLNLFHAHQPSFSINCGIDGCQKTYKNFRTFRNHVSTFHQNDPSLADDRQGSGNAAGYGINDNGEENSEETNDAHLDSDAEQHATCSRGDDTRWLSSSDLQRSSALFLLGMKEKHQLTQVALVGVIRGVTSLMQNHLSALQADINQLLVENGTSQFVIQQLNGLFSENGSYCLPFVGLETQHQQLQYYRTNFQFIEPVRITLGERRQWKGVGSKRKCVLKMDEMMYVPILDTLQSILNNELHYAEIQRGHRSDCGLTDYCDGESFQSHPLFSREVSGLQIFFYFDELEVCNPLGSRVKTHKLGMFYFTLGNFRPKQRSKLSSIFLVAIVKHKILNNYGMDAVIRPFVDDVKKLENGHCFLVDGIPQVWFGTVATVSADNLASLAI